MSGINPDPFSHYHSYGPTEPVPPSRNTPTIPPRRDGLRPSHTSLSQLPRTNQAHLQTTQLQPISKHANILLQPHLRSISFLGPTEPVPPSRNAPTFVLRRDGLRPSHTSHSRLRTTNQTHLQYTHLHTTPLFLLCLLSIINEKKGSGFLRSLFG